MTGSGRLALSQVLGQLPYASNVTLLALDPDGERWVYKPARGEEPLWDFAWGSLVGREVATYLVSEAMGLGLVPETRLARGPWGEGCAQRFIDEDPDWDPTALFRPRLDPVLWPVAVLDLVTNNADRKAGHLLRETGSGRLWAIDHGLTFHPEPKLRTVLWGFAGQRLPDEMVAALERLSEALSAGLCSQVEQLVGSAEAEALVARVQGLCSHPLHPHPPTDRPAVPWPLW